jgi:hypothetical protein
MHVRQEYEEISDEDQYLTDVEAEEEELGGGWGVRRLTDEPDEAWINDYDDLDDAGMSGAMPSWARMPSDQLFMDHSDHMPSVDEFMELFQAHARDFDNYLATDGRRQR